MIFKAWRASRHQTSIDCQWILKVLPPCWLNFLKILRFMVVSQYSPCIFEENVSLCVEIKVSLLLVHSSEGMHEDWKVFFLQQTFSIEWASLRTSCNVKTRHMLEVEVVSPGSITDSVLYDACGMLETFHLTLYSFIIRCEVRGNVLK